MLRASLRWAHGGPAALEAAIDGEMTKRRRELERGMTLLGTLGNNAPFVGLLGTVIGVIVAFADLADGQNKVQMDKVMGGIAEALIATGVGLFVAIPAVVAFNVFQKKIGDIEDNVARCPSASARSSPSARRMDWTRPSEAPPRDEARGRQRARSGERRLGSTHVGGPRRRRRSEPWAPRSERRAAGAAAGIVGINVTPMVDVMLVLLVIMMVSCHLHRLARAQGGAAEDARRPMSRRSRR